MDNNSLYRNAMQFGAYNGLAKFVLFLLLYFTVANPLGNWTMLGALFTITFIAIGTKQFRDQACDGYITYGRALAAGLMVAVFSSALYAILLYLFGTLADGTILDAYKKENITNLDEARKYLSSEKLLSKMDEAAEEIQKMSLGRLCTGFFTNGLIGGLVISLITAAIFRKNKPLFDESSTGNTM